MHDAPPPSGPASSWPARRPPALVLGLLGATLVGLVGSCAGTGAPGAPGTDPALEARTRALAALEEGRLEDARAALDEVLVVRWVDEARSLLAEDRPEDALNDLDRALGVDPRSAEARLLRADASLALAEKGMARGGSALLVEGALQDAYDGYAGLPETPRTLLGASRASWLLQQPDRALELAQRASDELARGAEHGELPIRPQRMLAEAAFGAYVAAASDEGRKEEAAALFQRAEAALGDDLGRSLDDPWAYGKLSDLYEWAERWADARRILEEGLNVLPEDVSLLERLGRVVRREGDAADAVRAYAEHNARHPGLANGLWYEARTRFDHATDELLERQLDPDEFRRAAELFRACRAADPALEAACLAYEVMCPAGVGWCHVFADEPEAAVKSFLEMDGVRFRGMEWSIEGRILSGVRGIAMIAGRYYDEERWLDAAETFWILMEYEEENDVWANNAGFLYRDAAVQEEFDGRRLCNAARGQVEGEEALAELRALAGVEEGAPDERARFREAADELLAAARQHMARSWEAYQRAARLVPDDVRVVNDAGLVQVYYLHTDHEAAEALLRSAVEKGAGELATFPSDDALDDEQRDARWELLNAWGDAHQNLGLLAYLRGDVEGAIRWCERSLEIGPEPRPQVENGWLPFLRGERDSSGPLSMEALRTWGEPCTEATR